MRKKDAAGATVLISTANCLNFGEGEDGGKVVSQPGEVWMKSSFSTSEPWQQGGSCEGHKCTNLVSRWSSC